MKKINLHSMMNCFSSQPHTIKLLLIMVFSFRLNGLEASNYHIAPLYKYVIEADKCMEREKLEKKKRKATTLYHLTKYLVQDK